MITPTQILDESLNIACFPMIQNVGKFIRDETTAWVIIKMLEDGGTQQKEIDECFDLVGIDPQKSHDAEEQQENTIDHLTKVHLETMKKAAEMESSIVDEYIQMKKVCSYKDLLRQQITSLSNKLQQSNTICQQEFKKTVKKLESLADNSKSDDYKLIESNVELNSILEFKREITLQREQISKRQQEKAKLIKQLNRREQILDDIDRIIQSKKPELDNAIQSQNKDVVNQVELEYVNTEERLYCFEKNSLQRIGVKWLIILGGFLAGCLIGQYYH